jgi:hypothetical protein
VEGPAYPTLHKSTGGWSSSRLLSIFTKYLLSHGAGPAAGRRLPRARTISPGYAEDSRRHACTGLPALGDVGGLQESSCGVMRSLLSRDSVRALRATESARWPISGDCPHEKSR